MVNSRRVKPHWLGLLLKTRFFEPCDEHKASRKSEVNIYCIECSESMCQHCLSSSSSALHNRHGGHHLLQIRRYIYQDVIRIHDMQKYVDCSRVQPYIVNGAKVVLLNPKKQSKPVTNAGNNAGALCGICQRTIPEPNRYCSIACKASKVGSGSSGFAESEPLFVTSLNSDLDGLSSAKEHASPSDVSSPWPSHWTGDDRQEGSAKASLGSSPGTQGGNRRKGVPRRAQLF